MARPIKLTEEFKEAVLEDFKQILATATMTSTGFEYKKKMAYTDKRKATVYYTREAWFKTIMLVETNQKEVGWHGVCVRDQDDPAVFHITDILVYPQKVTAATIDADPEGTVKWFDELDDDTFNNLRFHGHSHVNMAVSPSSVDMEFRANRLSQVSADGFYIFQIFNKRGDISTEIYDLSTNTLYETADVTTCVPCEDMKEWDSYKAVGKLLAGLNPDAVRPAFDLFTSAGVGEFLKDASAKVTEETYTPKPQYITGGKGKGKAGGNKYSYGSKNTGARKGYDPYGYTDERGYYHYYDDDGEEQVEYGYDRYYNY